MLKVDVSRNQMAIRGISLMTRQTGKATRRIDFSWTWKEKRKKAREVFTKASLNCHRVGLDNSFKDEGRTNNRVRAKLRNS